MLATKSNPQKKFSTENKTIKFLKIKEKNVATLNDPLPIDITFSDGFINYFNVVLTKQQLIILKKGPRYSLHIIHKTK